MCLSGDCVLPLSSMTHQHVSVQSSSLISPSPTQLVASSLLLSASTWTQLELPQLPATILTWGPASALQATCILSPLLIFPLHSHTSQTDICMCFLHFLNCYLVLESIQTAFCLHCDTRESFTEITKDHLWAFFSPHFTVWLTPLLPGLPVGEAFRLILGSFLPYSTV